MTMLLSWKGLCPPLDTASPHGYRQIIWPERGGGETFWEHFIVVQDGPQKWSWWRLSDADIHIMGELGWFWRPFSLRVFSPFFSDSWQEGREAPVAPDNHYSQQNANEVSHIEPGQRRVANKTSPPLRPFSSGLWNLNLNPICRQGQGFFQKPPLIHWLTHISSSRRTSLI